MESPQHDRTVNKHVDAFTEMSIKYNDMNREEGNFIAHIWLQYLATYELHKLRTKCQNNIRLSLFNQQYTVEIE